MVETSDNSVETKGKLFSVGQMTVATFIGSPIAGCLLLARNYRNLGKKDAAFNSFAVGLLSTIFVFIIAFSLPEKFPNFVLPMAYTIGMREGLKYLQGDVIAAYEAQEEKASWLIAIGVGIGCLILVTALAIGVVFLLIPE